MDRNQIIGIVLIAAILIGYMVFTAPSKEEIEAARQEQIRQDSINKVEEEQARLKAAELAALENDSVNKIEFVAIGDSTVSDTTRQNQLKEKFASFGESAVGENKFVTIENDLLKLTLSTKGGRPYSVQLKNYQTHDSLPLILFDGNETEFGMTFFAENRKISTNEFFFENMGSNSSVVANKSKESVNLRLNAGEGKYIEYTYTIVPGSYLLDFDIRFVGMDELISKNNSYIDINWYVNMPGLEKGKQWENQNSGVYYKHYQDEVDWLSETGSDDENISTKIKWIAFKQQFFSSIILSKDAFLNAKLEQVMNETDPDYLKECTALFSIPFDGNKDETVNLALYYGPNQYKILNNIHLEEGDDLNLKRMIPLGWGIFGWINRFAIIPIFNWLGGFIGNYGLLILLMTLIIKFFLFPLTYKSYKSSAKMRVLKPQIDEINKKIPKDKAMERQQATMALYRKAGVNPMGGCLPMLIQFPFLIAMYRFFPASIELRQKAFLWTDDLSSYDSILDLPFNIPMYGDHISLFTLLMAVSIVLSTKINGAQMQTGSSQMPGMKMMMWMMPVMMLLWFNNYSSGLSYYYFLSNVITIGQTLLIRNFIDDEAVLQKLNENKKKPKKKSKFQARLEEAAKQRQQIQKRK
jgi:YidC/Oxa1 family membrane protein insertase